MSSFSVRRSVPPKIAGAFYTPWWQNSTCISAPHRPGSHRLPVPAATTAPARDFLFRWCLFIATRLEKYDAPPCGVQQNLREREEGVDHDRAKSLLISYPSKHAPGPLH